jgi:hypothetical protein
MTLSCSSAGIRGLESGVWILKPTGAPDLNSETDGSNTSFEFIQVPSDQFQLSKSNLLAKLPPLICFQ